MTKVLVTGGAGFIGSQLSEALLKKGYDVTVLDNLIYGKKEWVPSAAHFIQGDICDIDVCHTAMKNITAVFHCAAMSRSAPSLDAIETCTEVNIRGTQNILLAARAAGVKKIIYSGSSTYYGSQQPPHREYETPSQFLNFYALSKYVGEKYCLMFDEVFDLPCVILRYFNVYGPRQPKEGAYALVFGIFLRNWSEGKALEIHGEGLQSRDFVHVEDVITANIAAFESDVRHQIFNVGSGVDVSIKKLANMISLNHVHTHRRSADAEITLADISRIQAMLGWKPEKSFQKGVQEMMERVKAGLD